MTKIDLKEMSKSQKIIIASAVVLILLIVIIAVAVSGKADNQPSYKETAVKYGTLTVGVTESGSVDIGTATQTFDLDMSALQRVETGNATSGVNGISGNRSGSASGFGSTGMGGGMPSAGGMGMSGAGGMNMFSQMLGGGANLIGSSDATSLTVESVEVSVGQQVSKGDTLYLLADSSVLQLEEELESNVEKAKTDLDALYADQTLSKQVAQYTYESSLAYGDYAKTERDTTLQELADNVENCRITLERAQATLAEYQTRLADVAESFEAAAKTLENCRYSVTITPASKAYYYAYYYQMTEEAQATYDSLEQQKEQMEKNVEQAQANVEKATKNYAAAKRSLEHGKLTANETYDLRSLAYTTAQETYDVTMAYLEEDAKTQEEIYRETQEKWEEFSSYIRGNAVLAQYDGVITSVDLAVGDDIYTGTTLVTLYDMEEVTMTVSVYENNMTDIAVGSVANISFDAYPETLFVSKVTDISEANTDSNGNISYEVTVNLEGDVSGLFQGMTGEITFVTEQSEETLYVLKRAITTVGEKSYVKVRNENGKVVKKEVITGFTDGTQIQIIEGIAEGDIVLIESKVGKS
ncbi:MAG: efflux RND transporter periplasmic adaptor subunit [Lachnospiraceae bacterium]|nr:efflux RND transporter periplasmic adaptor subunit [Lachnospiraceae bacterium]